MRSLVGTFYGLVGKTLLAIIATEVDGSTVFATKTGTVLETAPSSLFTQDHVVNRVLAYEVATGKRVSMLAVPSSVMADEHEWKRGEANLDLLRRNPWNISAPKMRNIIKGLTKTYASN